MRRYSGKRTKFQHVIIPNDDEKWKQRHIIWKWCRANQAHTKEVDSADHDERQVHPKSFTLRTQKCKIQRSYCRRMKPLWVSYSPGIFVGISVIELEQSGQKSEREIKSEIDETKLTLIAYDIRFLYIEFKIPFESNECTIDPDNSKIDTFAVTSLARQRYGYIYHWMIWSNKLI